ncbi:MULTISPECIES: YndJ family protein [Bacillaceae]|uniref:YndJ family protein n=1 Tax=Bacillaceae TaxID=186817 RepID=UPI001E4E4001|nr:YndJ family protein [Bacillus sp. Au-Bac7]MCE4048775.1 YndJ family protein [Bacillus sp. Au-Bac7]
MKAGSHLNSSNTLIVGGVILFLTNCFLTTEPYILLLTAAQQILVPMTLQLIMELNKKQIIFIWTGLFSVLLLQVITIHTGQMILSIIYLLFTLTVALSGLRRFLKRGFVNWAEISIDIGMMYLFMGGIWFFIHINGINTGFSHMLNWLTAIHFHYSAFILPVSIGLFGRIHTSKLYNILVPIILAAPMLVAVGITFWPLLEFISVIFYIFGIYGLIYLAMKTKFPAFLQGLLIRISYSSLGVTILFSLIYSVGRAFGKWYVTLDFMLIFHGLVNCLLFGLLGIIGWAIHLPKTKQPAWSFPVSNIRGQLTPENTAKSGLVDDLSMFVDIRRLPPMIVDFYEHTDKYRLFAAVHWAGWFKPLLLIYKPVSRLIQQLNLPVSKQVVEMNGTILSVNEALDGRNSPRAWIRKVNGRTVFTAIYSSHKTQGRAYMNIALPLPFSTMIGILKLDCITDTLELSSTGGEDPGIYLAIGTWLFRLPLSENFVIEQTTKRELTAIHKMKLFGVPFLKIDYRIITRDEAKQIN